TDQAVHYYGLRAKGGAGLIIIEASAIDYPVGRSVLNCACSDDRYIPTLKKLTDEIHKYDAKVALQIMHSGRQTSAAICGSQPVSCSEAVSAQALYADQPRALTLYECKETVRQFGKGALRAREAGFDAVEVHYAHGYLMSAFLSPNLNSRTDEYGGMEGGLKMACEVVQEVKARCGRDYPVLVRINGDDYHPAGGVTHIDARMISVALEQAGADCINISSGLRESDHPLHDQTMASPKGSWVYMAEGIKKTVKVPVMVAKHIPEDMVEGILAEGKSDFVCIGRPHITDPEYGNKLLGGRAEEILPCIWCAQGCFDVLWMLSPTTCLVNPAAGRMDEKPIDQLKQAPVKKKVLVVGGGPAGCEAALVAAGRGHDVTLYEKEDSLGGAYRLVIRSRIKQDVERLFTYFERALPRAGVQVMLKKNATPSLVERDKADAVIIAAGADAKRPAKIKGIRGKNVVSAEDVMRGKAEVGDRVAIWTCSYHCPYTCGVRLEPVAGDLTGVHSHYSYACAAGYGATDTAEHLATQGKLVSIVTEREDAVPGMGFTSRSYLMKRFYRENVRICRNARVKEITGDGLIIEKAGITFLLDADTVIVNVGCNPRRDLFKALKGKVPELYRVGDCDKVGNAMKAIESAYETAMKI
ncbi:MAG TPA: FAD-dependent oxidoreductase, partial [Desulfobacteraceae bacterium]|nr:FAD-dependent oxidoreductase [Desulfobacteraceae bacterium]